MIKKILPIIFLISCTNTKEQDRLRTLDIHIPKMEINLDPQHMSDLFSMMINMQIYRSLLGFSASGEVIPSLAKHWKKSEDGRIYTFILADKTFSDGTPIESKHVVNTFARAFKTKAEITGDLNYIVGVEEYLKSGNIGDFGVKELSKKEVAFKLKTKSNIFLKQIASVDLSILPLETPDSALSNTRSFSGPYKVESVDGDEIKLTLWIKREKSPKKVRFFKIDRSDSINYALQKKTDYLGFETLTQEQLSKLNKEGWQSFLNAVTMERFLILNPKKVSFNKRRDIARIINPKEIVSLANNNLLLPAWGAIPDVYPGHLNEEEYRATIPLVKSSDLKEVEIEYHKNDSIAVQLIGAIKESFSKINVKLNTTALDSPTYYDHFFNGNGTILLAAKGIDYPDGYSNLAYFSSYPKINYLHVDSKNINKMLQDLVALDNEDHIVKGYKNVQKAALLEYTFVPISFGSGFAGLWSKKVKFVPAHPMGIQTLPFEDIEMK